MESMGAILTLVRAVPAALFAGIGSVVGVGITGGAAAGVVTEGPNKFSKTLVLQLLPGTQDIYGLPIGFTTLAQIGVVGGSVDTSLAKSSLYLTAYLPMAFVGWFSAIKQDKAVAASIGLVAKKPNQSGKAMIFPAIVETYVILALLIPILAIFGIAGINV